MNDLRKAHAEHGSTSLRLAAEMALEALESVYGKGKRCEAAIKELRQALAQPEQGNSSLNYHIAESNTPLDKIVEIAIQGHANTRDAIRWAMQQERDACAKLVEADGLARGDEGLVLIKAAGRIRARSEKPPVKTYCGGKPNYCTPEVTPNVDAVNMSQERVDETAKREHELWCDSVTKLLLSMPPQIPPCNCKPKREWVGLTEEEVESWRGNYDFFDSALVREVEAKLKEKNT